MRELPILFSGEMVRALLDGRKTQTRRIVKPHIVDRFVLDSDGKLLGSYKEGDVDSYPTIDDAPYQPGDILYVRETWTIGDVGSYSYNYGPERRVVDFYYKADDSMECKIVSEELADKMETLLERLEAGGDEGMNWKPSIHMPKEAARIWLEVTNVRVERLQEITYDDCLREGMWNYGTDVDTLAAFQELWQNLNAKRGYGWDVNPWVWVIEFKRLEVRP